MNTAFPDPSLPDPSVRFIEPYTPAYPPRVADLEWYERRGEDFEIIGQHTVLNGTVEP